MANLNRKGKELFGLDDDTTELVFEQQGIDARVIELGNGRWKIDLPEGIGQDSIEFQANSTDESKVLDQAAQIMKERGILQDIELSEHAKEVYGIKEENSSSDGPYDPENPSEALDIIQDIVGDDSEEEPTVEQEEPEDEEEEDDEEEDEEEEDEDEEEEEEEQEESQLGKVDKVLSEIEDLRQKVPSVNEQEDDDEIENAQDAIRELAQTDFDASSESVGRMGELIKGIGFDESDDAAEFVERLNKAVTDIALDLGMVQEENVPDDLL